MHIQPTSTASFQIPTRALVAFLSITFVIAWALIGMYIVLPEVAVTTFGELSGSHPIFFLATWSPAIAAFGVVFIYSGGPGIRAFLSRLLLWRCSVGWAFFIVLVIPLVFVVGSLVKGGPVLALGPSDGLDTVALLFMMLFLGPVEEFGWRGVMQPLLQRHMAPVWAGLIIGVTWGLWHLPAFYLSSTVFADWEFLPFFIGNVTLAVLVTPLFNRSRGSLILPMLFHWQLINPFWPDAQPWDTAILAVLAVIILWWNRSTMLKQDDAVTEVVPSLRRRPPKAGV